MNTKPPLSPRHAALIAGISLLIMAVVAGISFGYIHGSLVVPGDAGATLTNLTTSMGLFKTEILGWTIIIVLDAMVAWSLYHFFKETSKKISLISSLLRILYTLILGIAILNLAHVLLTLNDMPTAEVKDLSYKILNHINAFENTWSKGLIIFGVHLVVLGILAIKAEYVPRFWGVLLILAGISYILVPSLRAFYPTMTSISTIESILAIPMTIGEVGFAVWLVIKGGRRK